MQPRASFLPPPYPCTGAQQQQQQSQFLPQITLNPYQQLFYNQDVHLQQQQTQQPQQLQQQQQQSKTQQQHQQQYISMCLQQPQSQIIQPQQLLLQPQIPQQSMESQQQLPFLYTQALHDQHQQEQQTLESLTAQVAALLYSNFGNLPVQQQVQFYPPESSQQQLLHQGSFPEAHNTKMNGFNNNTNSNGNNNLGFLDQHPEILQNNAIPLGLDSSQLMPLSSASFLDQLAQLASVPNDQNVSLATALAAQIFQTSPNYNFSSSLGEVPTASSTSQGTTATPELIFTTLNQNKKSEQKQSNSDTQLNSKPFNRSSLEKHHAFSPVDASHNARTSSPHSSASRISNSQIHTHQPFDTQTYPREQKTLPIVFLQHPQQDENTDKKIKFQDAGRMLEGEDDEDQNMKNSKSRTNTAVGQTNKLIKKKKKSSYSAKARQIPQQSSDSFTNSSSLTISLKKNENSTNVPASNDVKTYLTPTINQLHGQQGSCNDAQDIVIPLSKDTKLFDDLLDPFIRHLRENTELENKEKKSNSVGQVQKKPSKASLSRQKKQAKQQKSKQIDENMNQDSSENELIKIQVKQTGVMSKVSLDEKPHKIEQEEEEDDQENGQLDEEKQETHPQQQEQQEQLTELVNHQLFVPSSPESVPLNILRISPRRRVCSSEMHEESDQEDHHHSNSKQTSEVTHDQKNQTSLVTPVKKIQRLKRISQITEEQKNRKQHKLSTKSTLPGLPHRNQTIVDKKQPSKPAISESPTVLFKTRNQSKVLNEITKTTKNESDNNDSTTFQNIDSFSEATQSLMNQFEKHYLKYVIHSNIEERINEFKTFMKNARKNDELIGLLLNPRACPFSQSFIDFLRLPAIKWIRKNIDPKKQQVYFQLIQMFKSEDRGISGLRPRRDRNLLSNFAPAK